MSDRERYLLSDGDHERIFRTAVAPDRLNVGEPREDPVVVLLGGQPGAGKSRIKAALLSGLAGFRRCGRARR